MGYLGSDIYIEDVIEEALLNSPSVRQCLISNYRNNKNKEEDIDLPICDIIIPNFSDEDDDSDPDAGTVLKNVPCLMGNSELKLEDDKYFMGVVLFGNNKVSGHEALKQKELNMDISSGGSVDTMIAIIVNDMEGRENILEMTSRAKDLIASYSPKQAAIVSDKKLTLQGKDIWLGSEDKNILKEWVSFLEKTADFAGAIADNIINSSVYPNSGAPMIKVKATMYKEQDIAQFKKLIDDFSANASKIKIEEEK